MSLKLPLSFPWSESSKVERVDDREGENEIGHTYMERPRQVRNLTWGALSGQTSEGRLVVGGNGAVGVQGPMVVVRRIARVQLKWGSGPKEEVWSQQREGGD